MILRRVAFSFFRTGISVTALLCFAAMSIGPAAASDAAPQRIGPKTAGTPTQDVALAVAARGTDVHVAGYTHGSLDGPNAGQADVFVRKYGEDGDIVWGRQFGTPLFDSAQGIANDASGNVYVGGYTRGSIAGSRGDYDGFLRKYNKNGVVQWTRQFGTATVDMVNAVATDGSGNVYVTGLTLGSLQGANKGSTDTFVRKYSPAGAVLWTRQFGTPAGDEAAGVATDSQGNVFIAGNTTGALAGAHRGSIDIFLIKLNQNGALVWQRQFGTSGTEFMASGDLTVDRTGAAVIAGRTDGAFPGFVNAGSSDIFMRKYSSAGAVLKTDQAGTAGGDFAMGVTGDSTNNVYVVGYTSGTFGGASAGGDDVFVRKYASAGNVVWTRQFGTSATDQGFGIAAPTSGKIYVVGFTGGALVATQQGDGDAFVRRLGANGGAVWTDQ